MDLKRSYGHTAADREEDTFHHLTSALPFISHLPISSSLQNAMGLSFTNPLTQYLSFYLLPFPVFVNQPNR